MERKAEYETVRKLKLLITSKSIAIFLEVAAILALSWVLYKRRLIATGHRENWDGSGYPISMMDTKIQLSGCLMVIADVYNALISKRSYKKAWSHEDACNEIISLSGSKFDPFLIEAFNREQDNFKLIAEIAKD